MSLRTSCSWCSIAALSAFQRSRSSRNSSRAERFFGLGTTGAIGVEVEGRQKRHPRWMCRSRWIVCECGDADAVATRGRSRGKTLGVADERLHRSWLWSLRRLVVGEEREEILLPARALDRRFLEQALRLLRRIVMEPLADSIGRVRDHDRHAE